MADTVLVRLPHNLSYEVKRVASARRVAVQCIIDLLAVLTLNELESAYPGVQTRRKIPEEIQGRRVQGVNRVKVNAILHRRLKKFADYWHTTVETLLDESFSRGGGKFVRSIPKLNPCHWPTISNVETAAAKQRKRQLATKESAEAA